MANHYRAADFDTLVDSPIVAGTLDIRQFVVDGSIHVIADAGEYPDWDGGQAAKDIEKIVRDLRVHQILEGTNEIMRLIVSRKLIEGAR